MRIIINVISGKGGTGKTLLTAVMAELLANAGADVLAIDMDVFVRGLTALLYFHKNEVINITKKNEWPISAFFKNKSNMVKEKEIAICKYRSFDVIPSVAKVNEILCFSDIMPNSINEANEILKAILQYIPEKYDYVFLDSRAGFDELIAATHQISNFSLCVEEDDDISRITSDNLIKQLKEADVGKPVFRIINKARIMQKDDKFYGIEFLGNILFDTDVMNSFGTKEFWKEIEKSLYKEHLIKVWNKLAKKMELEIILEEKRVSPIGLQKLENHISMLSSVNRIFFVYGIIIMLLSFYLLFYESGFFEILVQEPKKLIGLFMYLLGSLLIIIPIFINNKK